MPQPGFDGGRIARGNGAGRNPVTSVAMDTALVLLDDGAACGTENATVVHWSRPDVPDGQLSLPRLANREADETKREFLAWVHDLGALDIDGRTVAERLMVRDRLSGWWLGLVAEASPMKCPTIFEVFKLRALERLTGRLGTTALVYAGRDRVLAGVLSRWCQETGLSFRWVRDGDAVHRPRRALGRRARGIPHALQALAFLAGRWWQRFRRVRPPTGQIRPSSDGDALMVTFFPNVDAAAWREGRFRSAYWQGLHDVLDKRPENVRWLWLYNPSNQMSLDEAAAFRDQLNANSPGGPRFHLLEEALDGLSVVAVLGAWLRMAVASLGLRAAPHHFRLPGSAIDIYPLVRADWVASLRGIAAMDAAIFLVGFERLLARCPRPDWVAYTFENQPWETALVAACRARGVERVIAHQHEAVKPYNLRLFADPRTYSASGPAAVPLPDVLAVGGRMAEQAFRAGGWPESRLALVEALRFQGLGGEGGSAGGGGRRLLVVTGYLAAETRYQLGLLAGAVRAGALDGAHIRIKPHPFLPVAPMLEALGLNQGEPPIEVVDTPLGELWPETDVAVFANSTAAVLEAVYARVPSIVCTPADDLDYCPLPEDDEVVAHVEDADGLAAALTVAFSARERPKPPEDFFVIDPALPRWRALLAGRMHETAAETVQAAQ